MRFKTLIEPFKIKVVEPLKMTTLQQREEILKKAGYNLFNIPAKDVLIDLLTDSGTAAMSDSQWAEIMRGDEAYAGSRSFFRFEETVKKITGMRHIIPVHQGRAAEKILFSILPTQNNYILNNTHFDTTRGNIEYLGGHAVDLPIPEANQPDHWHPFKGNMDIQRLENFILEKGPAKIPLVMITVTNNAAGGQPVSMENIRQVRQICNQYKIPLFLDACRFAENVYFIKLREKGYEEHTPLEIAQELFSYADGCTMSAKKDALANIGGFLALRDDSLAQQARNLLIITEGFPTYGGLAGRDLAAIAQGLEEVLEEDYLRYRLTTIEYTVESLMQAGVPVIIPAGGHAVYLDARRFAPHIPPHEFPGHAIVVELYRLGGIRSVEIGSVMFGQKTPEGEFLAAPMELVRLAMPRRVYTQSHINYVIEVICHVHENRDKLRGYRITYEPPLLRHFTARFEPLG
ncbi:MAG: tryptophanase [Bacteroidia bacterium]